MCVSTTRIRSRAVLQAQRPLSALSNSEAVLSLLGWNLLSGRETALTPCVRTVTAHTLAHLLQAIIMRAAP
jgi:hypothetical protein